jgi:methionine sulfoxide reductase heme-binding subunit
MAQRNPTPGKGNGFPWAGAGALALAGLAAGAVLAGPELLGAWLQPWYLTRAAGFVAFVLLWASVCIGLLQSTGFFKGVTSPLANIDLHTYLSLAALYATTFHAVILLFDRYVPFRLAEILIPFAGDYKPALVGIGGVAFYVALAVTVSTYLRARLKPNVWRTIHLSSLGAFALALGHAAALGTDTRAPAAGFLYRFCGLSVLVLVLYRVYLEVGKAHADSARGR